MTGPDMLKDRKAWPLYKYQKLKCTACGAVRYHYQRTMFECLVPPDFVRCRACGHDEIERRYVSRQTVFLKDPFHKRRTDDVAGWLTLAGKWTSSDGDD